MEENEDAELRDLYFDHGFGSVQKPESRPGRPRDGDGTRERQT